jgi:hypothetical protein
MRIMPSWFRQSERPKPAIRLEETGLTVTQGDMVVSHIEYGRVRQVVAFQEDHFSYDMICIGFRVDESDDLRRVTEESLGYTELLRELPRRFPGIRTDWFHDVAFPAFMTNWTTLWVAPTRPGS